MNIFLRNEGEIKTLSNEGNLRHHHQRTYLTSMAKGSSVSTQKGNAKRRHFGISEMKKNNGKRKKRENTIDFLSLLEFSKLCFTVEAKIITLSDVVLNVCRENICINYVIHRKDR